MATIVRDSAGSLFFVRDTDNENLAHVWFGIAVKRVKGAYVSKTGAKQILVRKAGCTVIS